MRRLFHRSSNRKDNDDYLGLEVLHTPGAQTDQDEQAAIQVDIVAVHGLNGHRRNTWTYVGNPNGNTTVLWLNELLPQHIPHARIMTFGYKANVFGNTSTDGIGDTARTLLSELLDTRDSVNKRPIVFIGHGLGGLVIKKALRIAKNEKYFESISKDVKGLMFFGTPHQGANAADWANVATQLVRATFLKPKKEFIEALRRDSEILTKLTDDFVPLAGEYAIVSFWEQDYLPGLRSAVVPKHSAVLNLPWEVKRPLRGNHITMCRFSGLDDPAFLAVWKAIRNIISDRLPSGGAKPESRGLLSPESRPVVYGAVSTHLTLRSTLSTVPWSSSPIFTGQNYILEHLTHFFFPESDKPHEGPRPRRVSLLYGLGGSGKSQICLKFCETYQQRFWGIFWIDARSGGTVEDSYAEIARAVEAEEQTSAAVKELLSTCGKEWLLIIDGADDPAVDVSKYFPSGNRGNILISSRNQECRRHAPHAYYEVDKMLPDEAMCLLLEAALIKQPFKHTQWAQAALIVQELGYLALAIDQAGSLIANGCPLGDYLTKYRGNRKRLLSERPQQGTASYEWTVYTAWEISYQAVRRRNAAAAAILEHFSFLHYDKIPKDIFRRASDFIHDPGNISDQGDNRVKEDPDIANFALLDPIPDLLRRDDSENAEWDDYGFEEAIRMLCSHSLVRTDSCDKEPVYLLHPLVHSWARERLSDEKQLAIKKSTALLLSYSINQAFMHEVSSASTFRFQRSILPHVYSCRKAFAELSTCIPGQGPSYAFAMLYSVFSMWEDAEELLLDPTTTKRQVHGPKHQATPGPMESLARVHSEQGPLRAGGEPPEQVASVNKEVLGLAHEDSLLSTKPLALTYLDDYMIRPKTCRSKRLKLQGSVLSGGGAGVCSALGLLRGCVVDSGGGGIPESYSPD